MVFCIVDVYIGGGGGAEAQWQSGNTLVSHLWGRGSVPGPTSSGKAGTYVVACSWSAVYSTEPWQTVCTGLLWP